VHKKTAVITADGGYIIIEEEKFTVYALPALDRVWFDAQMLIRTDHFVVDCFFVVPDT
jgi:hypothetical protein